MVFQYNSSKCNQINVIKILNVDQLVKTWKEKNKMNQNKNTNQYILINTNQYKQMNTY